MKSLKKIKWCSHFIFPSWRADLRHWIITEFLISYHLCLIGYYKAYTTLTGFPDILLRPTAKIKNLFLNIWLCYDDSFLELEGLISKAEYISKTTFGYRCHLDANVGQTVNGIWMDGHATERDLYWVKVRPPNL